ncbi:MAG: energy transducer TonB [Candidatus Acidiferrales bacterium]
MADPVQTAQATALEIPVTVQGSKTVEGAERRELFTETTKTILVSDNGAVLKLDAKVSPGQCVFLRNDKSGREILCKVLGSREAGYTDLEFTVYDPKFWEVPAEQPPSSAPKPEAKKEIEEVMSNSAPVPSAESWAPASAGIPSANPENADSALTASSAETTESSPAPSKGAAGADTKDAVPDWDEARDAQLVALLASMDGKSKARRETPKAAKDAGDAASAAPSGDAANQAVLTGSKIAGAGTERLSSILSTVGRIRELMAKQNPIYVGVVAVILIAVVAVGVWHARSSPAPVNNRLSAFSAHSPGTPSSAGAAGLNTGGPASGGTSPNAKPLIEAQKNGAPVAQSVTPATAGSDATRSGKDVDSAESSQPRFVEPSANSDENGAGHAIHRNSNETKNAENVPARIVSETQPVIPAWAEDLDMEPVVKLDALIDEKGNLVEAKPISGPRMLQPSAERAVVLWVFEPGLSDGKPAATHITLTVEFQKPKGETN